MSLKLRTQSILCTPEGPSFTSAKAINFAIDETGIVFKAPKHHSGYSSRRSNEPDEEYKLCDMVFRSFYDEDFFLDDSWRMVSLLSRSWAFKGPLFTGDLGELSMSMGIITPTVPVKNISFFHPRAFEQAVGDYITVNYASHTFNGRSEWIAPLNWKQLTSFPCVAVTMDVMPDSAALNIKSGMKYSFFPISDHHIVYIVFNIEQRVSGLIEERDKIVNRSSMEKLAVDILNSLQVTLSPEAQVQQARALEGLDDTSLRKEFPPMKWTTPEQDAEWSEYVKMMESMKN